MKSTQTEVEITAIDVNPVAVEQSPMFDRFTQTENYELQQSAPEEKKKKKKKKAWYKRIFE